MKLNIFKKLFSTIAIILFSFSQCAFALGAKGDINTTIDNMSFSEQSIVGINVKDLKRSKSKYKKNHKKMFNIASSLKLLTAAAALDTLGKDYQFETAFYVNNNNLYLKLGADPFLTKEDLEALFEELTKKVNFKNIKKVYIDDSIIAQEFYPDGWAIDDFWPVIAPISPYIIDNNMVEIKVILSSDKKTMNVIQDSKYSLAVINELVISKKNKVEVEKDNENSKNAILLKGEINSDDSFFVPVDSPKAFFMAHLEDVFGKYKIKYNDKFYFSSMPKRAKKLASVSHNLEEIMSYSLKNSDNYSAEILFRVAGHNYAQDKNIESMNNSSLGTIENAKLMFADFYNNAKVDMQEISIVDASGVSRYNAASPNFVTSAIIYADKKTDIRNYLPTADEGTLSKRLRYLKGNLKAKTGTAKGVSTLSGIIYNKKEKPYAFCIMIQDYNKNSSELKAFEDDIIDCIFNL